MGRNGGIAPALAGPQDGAAPQQVAQAAVRPFAIPAQPLAGALTAFGQQSGFQVSVDSALLSGLRSAGVSGTLAPEDALRQLLAGTGVAFRAAGPRTVVLDRAPAQGAMTLDPVTVDAQAQAPAGSAAAGYRVPDAAVGGFGTRPLLETPFSVKVVPRELLLNRGSAEIDDLDKYDGSVSGSVSAPGWYAQPSIRGFTLNNWSNYRLNGLTIVNQQATGLENKERVEILKGLSGLQSGFAAPGGVINYVTKRPTAQPVTDLHLSATHFGDLRAHADVGRMVTERFGLRLNGVVEEERTHVDKSRGPRRFVSAAADLRLTPDTLVTFDVEHERRNQVNLPTIPLDVNGNVPRMVNPRTFFGETWATYPTRNTIATSKVEHHLSDRWSVSAEVNVAHLYRDQNSFTLTNLQPNGDARVNHYYEPDQTRDAVNLRLMTRGRFETAGIGHDLTAGYGRHWLKARWGGGFYGPIGTTNIYSPRRVAQPNHVIGQSSIRVRWNDESVFVNDVVSLAPAWDVHLGGRYTQVDRRSYNGSGVTTAKYEKGILTPSAAVVFKPLPNVSTYVSYVEGLEEGGTAPLGTTNANTVLDPLVSKQVEAGIKAEPDQITLETSVFRIGRVAEFTNAANTYVQDGRQTHLGWEASATGRVTPEWTVVASVMLLDAELSRTGNRATEGKRPRAVPDHRVALTTEYAPSQLTGWTFSGYWSRTGEQAVNDTNRAFIDSSDVFGLGARYETEIHGTPTTFRVNVENLFDTRYWAAANYGSLTAGAPRTVWGGVSVKF